MTPTETELREAREITERALRLPPIAREGIALEMLDSLQGPPEDAEGVKKAWQAEIACRIEQVERGEVELLDAHEALDQIEQELCQRRRQ